MPAAPVLEDALHTRLFCVAAMAALLTWGASAVGAKTAQRAVGLKSFAAAQAPEAATEACYAATPAAAQSCALAKCKRKAGTGACFALTLCAPGGWAGIMGVRVTEVSFADVLCGAPTKEALLAGLKSYCEGHLPQMQECHVASVWSPEGRAVTVDQSWSAKGFKR